MQKYASFATDQQLTTYSRRPSPFNRRSNLSNYTTSSTDDRFRVMIVLVLLPIRQGRGVVGVGVAIMAKVRAGVVLADVLGHDAAAGTTMAQLSIGPAHAEWRN